ncbi:MAG: FG-GAP repeat protein, partial [Gammaproteobacteria bacterium]|nr:FG-GAP repeat protein [Gammaproteobacteria bacterium]
MRRTQRPRTLVRRPVSEGVRRALRTRGGWLPGAVIAASLTALSPAVLAVNPIPAEFDLSRLDGTNGVVLKGAGSSVSGAGDVNGDGFDDIIIGAPFASPDGKENAGESYVVFGTPAGGPATFDLANLNGTVGFVLKGVDAGDLSGAAVSGAGDVNGDGFDDILIGARSADPDGKAAAGESYIVLGAAGGFPAAIELGSLDGSNGFVLKGIDAGDESGYSVGGAGDVNG